MTTRGKWLSATGLGLLTGAWFVAQLLLARHAQLAMYHQAQVMHERFLRMHPTVPVNPPMPVHTRYWLQPAAESVIALLACYLVAGALVIGGRRRWALLVVALPLTVFVSRDDASSLGLAWLQPFGHMRAWVETGGLVDALTVLAAIVAMGYIAPRREATTPVLPAVLRTLPIAIVAFGWWLVGSPIPDPSDRLFITRTLLLVLAAAVVATARLPLLVRIAVLFVMPFADPNMADGLIWGYTSWETYIHHVAVAGATVLYVAGMPAAIARLRAPSPAPAQ